MGLIIKLWCHILNGINFYIEKSFILLSTQFPYASIWISIAWIKLSFRFWNRQFFQLAENIFIYQSFISRDLQSANTFKQSRQCLAIPGYFVPFVCYCNIWSRSPNRLVKFRFSFVENSIVEGFLPNSFLFWNWITLLHLKPIVNLCCTGPSKLCSITYTTLKYE